MATKHTSPGDAARGDAADGTAPPPSDGRIRRGQARRAEILATALEVFGEQGYRGGSLREIAARVGISEAGILHHFGSKDALLAAVLEERDAKQAARREDAVAESVLDGVRALVHHNASAPGLVALYAVLSAEATDPTHPAHDYFVNRYATIRHHDDSRFEALRDSGEIHAGVRMETLGQLVTAVLDGLQLQWLLAPDDVDMESLLEDFLALLQCPDPHGASPA